MLANRAFVWLEHPQDGGLTIAYGLACASLMFVFADFQVIRVVYAQMENVRYNMRVSNHTCLCDLEPRVATGKGCGEGDDHRQRPNE